MKYFMKNYIHTGKLECSFTKGPSIYYVMGKGWVGGFGSSLRKKKREELRDFDVVFES